MKILAIYLLLFSAQAAFAFNTENYKPESLDELIKRSAAMVDDHNHEGGIELMTKNLQFTLIEQLNKYPYTCDTGFLMKALKMLGIGAKDKLPPITTCIDVKSKSGKVVTMYIQDSVSSYIPTEVKIGQSIELYVLWVYTNDADKLPRLLVNDFGAK